MRFSYKLLQLNILTKEQPIGGLCALPGLLLAMFFWWSCYQSPGANAAPDETAWKLVLDHATFGRCSGIFSETRIRFDDGVLKRLILPPYKESYLFNVETKRMMRAPNSNFEYMNGMDYRSATLNKIGPAHLLGLSATHYSVDLPARRLKCEYWATYDIKMNPQLAAICCHLGCAPPGYGVPLRVMIRSKAGKEELVYSVVKLEKYTPKPADFAPPEGYKIARDLFEMHFCDEATQYGDAVDKAFMLDYGSKKRKKD